MFGAVPQTSASAASHVYQTSTQASEASHVHHAAKRPRIGAKRRIASIYHNFIMIFFFKIFKSGVLWKKHKKFWVMAIEAYFSAKWRKIHKNEALKNGLGKAPKKYGAWSWCFVITPFSQKHNALLIPKNVQ